MGDPKKIRKSYSTPSHPWLKVRIDEENQIQREYGTKNKKEIWKMKSFLQNAKKQAKTIVTLKGEQAEKEKALLMGKLTRLGFLKEHAELDDVLGLTLKSIMDRRLQTILKKKGLARTLKQARQFIVHNHVKIGNQKITAPSYLVSVEEEQSISFDDNSPFATEDHPERSVVVNEDARKLKELKKMRRDSANARGARR
ncbi:MAG: 30S ribosomal protein S4 [Nanoarchaeota archaeon]|nr:30S ribosomal protein S4 [Nanoarchaeota archaeon]